jgi:aspartyl-tRNA(Asn)/glutamyl-tRNA(Gln) amidotransferase subunit B
VDLGLPGVLPVLNVEVVNKAITFGLAVDAHINQRNVFDRHACEFGCAPN